MFTYQSPIVQNNICLSRNAIPSFFAETKKGLCQIPSDNFKRFGIDPFLFPNPAMCRELSKTLQSFLVIGSADKTDDFLDSLSRKHITKNERPQESGGASQKYS